MRLRAGRGDDLAPIRAVCIRTGDAGGDATGTLPDVGILPDLFAEPYLRLEPELVTVVVDGEDAVVGYVLGTADTEGFVAAWRQQWLPMVAPRHPASPASDDDYARLVSALHQPERMRTPWIDAYPAHLHIDLLPAAQGGGLGRALIERFCAAVAAAGASGVHLGVDARNTGAAGFYRRVGFGVLAEDSGVIWFGRRLQHGATPPLGRCPGGC